MITSAIQTSRPTDRLSWLWLIVGAALLPFSAWQTVLPIAAWLAPVFIIRFARTQRAVIAVPVLAVVGCAAMVIAFRDDFLPALPIILIPILIAYGLMSSLGYLADRLLAPRLTGLPRTLIFPLTVTTVDYLQARFNPVLGTFGSPAYSQAGNLPLLQIVSVTGLWGLTFLIAWFAPVVNEAWERGLDRRAVRGSVGLFTGVLVAAVLFGSVRLAFFPPETSTVPVATIAGSRERYRGVEPFPFALTPGTEAERTSVRAQLAPMVDDLFTRTQQAARTGAKIIVWSESAALILQEDRAAVIERGQALARQEDIYLQMGLMIFRPTDRFPFNENRAVLVDSSGTILWDYHKTNPTPGPETATMLRGSGIIPTADSPFGRLATAICFDMDFPLLMQQAGQAGADLLLVGFLEWEQVRFTHNDMATYRAIENGTSLLRSTGEGISSIVDYQGRVLASVDSFAAEDPRLVTMVGTVPTKGAATIYGRIGDSFAYVCIAGLAALTVLAFVRRRAAVPAASRPAAPQPA